MQHVPRTLGMSALPLAAAVLSGCAALGLPDLGSTGSITIASDPAEVTTELGASPLPVATPVYVASSDGYSLTVPVGWAAADVSNVDGLAVAAAVAALDPSLGSILQVALDSTGARLSLVSANQAAVATGGPAPGVVVATMRTRGMPKDAARAAVEGLLASAPLVGEVLHSVETHPAGDAHRYDAVLAGDTVTLRLQAYVFRIGGDSFLVAAVAPEDLFASAQADFDLIVRSLRFGV